MVIRKIKAANFAMLRLKFVDYAAKIVKISVNGANYWNLSYLCRRDGERRISY